MLVRFTDVGDIILGLGAIITETGSSPYPSTAEAIIRDGSGNDLAWVNSVTGNLYLKGKLYEDIEVVWSIPVDSIKIKVNEEVMAFITSEGYLSLFLLSS